MSKDEATPNGFSGPQADKLLFQPTDDWEYNARLNWSEARFDFYIFGYKEAADSLVEIAKTESSQDFLIYPIAFLYRHYIELQLKKITDNGLKIKGKKGGFPQIHKITKLWKEECRPIVEDVWPNANRDPLDHLEDYLQQFEKIDPGSYSFRYPIDKNNRETLTDVQRINLLNLKKRVDEIGHLLNGISLEFSGILRHYQEEMERNYEL